MKKVIAALITVIISTCLLTGAFGEEVFGDGFYDTFSFGACGGRYSAAASGKYVYAVFAKGPVYRYDIESKEYQLITKVTTPLDANFDGEKPLSAQSRQSQEIASNAVYHIVADENGKLYGINPISGKIGIIDEQGCTWQETCLDTSLMASKGRTYAPWLYNQFIDNGILYGLFDISEINATSEMNSKLVEFDLSTGKCKVTDIPNAIAIAKYTDEKILMLRSSGNSVNLSEIDKSTHAVSNIISEVPVNCTSTPELFEKRGCVGCLSYNSAKNQIYLCTPNSFLVSKSNEAFEKANVMCSWDSVNPYWESCIMSNGNLFFQNGNCIVIEIEN